MERPENAWEVWDDDEFDFLERDLPEPLDPEDDEQAEPQPGDFWAPDEGEYAE